MEPYEIVQRLKALEDEVKELRQRVATPANAAPENLFGPGGKHQLISPLLWDRAIKRADALPAVLAGLKDFDIPLGDKIPIRVRPQGLPSATKKCVPAPPRPFYDLLGLSRNHVAYLCRKNPSLFTLDDLAEEIAEFQRTIGEHPRNVPMVAWNTAPSLFNFERADRLCCAVAKTLPRMQGGEMVRTILHWADHQYYIDRAAREPGYDA